MAKLPKCLFVLALMFCELDSDEVDSRLEPNYVIVGNMTAVVGCSVDIPCNTDTNDSVCWTYLQNQAAKGDILYFNYLVQNGHAARFEVRRPSERNFALTIKATLMSDSGMYECWDENGVGETAHRITLTVINNSGDTTRDASGSMLVIENQVDLSLKVTQPMPQETSFDVTNSRKDLKKSEDTDVTAIVLGVILSLVLFACLVYILFRAIIWAKVDKNAQSDANAAVIHHDDSYSTAQNIRIDIDENVTEETDLLPDCMPEEQKVALSDNDGLARNDTDQHDETQQQSTAEHLCQQPDFFTLLAVEMLELVLLRSFAKFYTDTYRSSRRTRTAVVTAYVRVAEVCQNWMMTLTGWPQSPTKHWVQHKLRRAIESACRPYAVFPRPEIIQQVRDVVFGVTMCGDKLVVAYTLTEKVDVFELYNLQQQPKSFQVNGMKQPQDIVACMETHKTYIAGLKSDNMQCVWRMSSDGNVAEWLSDNLIVPYARSDLKCLSIRSRRLLVACRETNKMIVYGPDAAELKCVSSSAIEGLLHAVETSRRTFIASHLKPKPSVTEIDDSGNVIRSFDESLNLLETPIYLALDSEDRILVLDKSKWRVLLLNSDLTVERILLEKYIMDELPLRMCYAETVGRLFVGDSYSSVRAFSIRSSIQR